MDRRIEREVKRFAVRVRTGALLGGLVDGLALGSLGFAAVLLVLRIVGVALEPAWWWALPVLLPAAGVAAWRAGHVGFGRRLSAQHLDRRLGLEGLLISACEVDAAAWEARLHQRLHRAWSVRPRAHLRRWLRHAAVGLLVLLGVALLPDPTAALRRHDPLGAEVLAQLEQKLEALAETEAVETETTDELQRRIAEIKDGAERDGVLSWSDVDTLEERLEHERDLQAGKLAKAMQGLASLAAQARDGETTAADAAKALKSALEAGLLEDLPKELLERLGIPNDGSSLEGLDAAMDAETMKQLAAALAEAAGDQLADLAGLEGLEGLEGLDLADLDAMLGEALEGFVEGEPCTLCDPTDEDCPG